MTPSLFALLLALPTGLAGFWLVLRPGRAVVAAGAALLALATASGYISLRMWQEAQATPAFHLTAPAGLFQLITPEQLPAALAASKGRPVLLELHADWCPSCIVWQQQVFSRPEVRTALSPLVLLQVDATDMTPEVQAMLSRYGIAGLPALLVFDRQGQEQPRLRLLGEMEADAFLHWIETRLWPSV